MSVTQAHHELTKRHASPCTELHPTLQKSFYRGSLAVESHRGWPKIADVTSKRPERPAACAYSQSNARLGCHDKQEEPTESSLRSLWSRSRRAGRSDRRGRHKISPAEAGRGANLPARLGHR